MKWLLITLLIFLSQLSFAKSFTFKTCDMALDESLSVTENFISYLSVLYKDGVMKTTDLESMQKMLNEKKILANPWGTQTTLTSAQIPHAEVINQYLSYSTAPDFDEVLKWLTATINKNKQTQKEKSKVNIDSEIAALPITFKRLDPAVMYNPLEKEKIWATTYHPIEMTDTPVTQMMWVKVMDYNPSHFTDGPDTVIYTSKSGKKIKMQPDNPVENVNWWSILVFANRLSEQHGLPPVYDLSAIKEWKGDPAMGDYEPLLGVSALSLVRINHVEEDVHLALGIRLPTWVEIVLLATNRGRSDSLGFSKEVDWHLSEYVWHNANSATKTHPQGSTHPVARLKAFVVDQEEFFDVSGNVGLWLHDWTSGSVKTRMGDWSSAEKFVSQEFVCPLSPLTRQNTLGFRLVRSLPK